MLIKTIKKIILILITILFISCPTPKNEEVPEYIQKKIWSITLEGSFPFITVQYGKYLYSAENKKSTNGSFDCRPYKLNLETGLLEWKTSEEYNFASFFTPVVYDGVVYCANSGTFYCFNDSDGSLAATVKLGETLEERRINGCTWNSLIISANEYLCWINYEDDNIANDGIMKLKISDIDFSKNPEEPQYVNPEYVWKSPNIDERIFSHLKEENGVVYFQTDTFNTDYPCRLGAVKIETGDFLWLKNIGMGGQNADSLMIVGDKLYVLEAASGCYNKYTGETIWEYIQTREDIMHEYYIGGVMDNWAGYTYDSGRLYFTTQAGSATPAIFGMPGKLTKNIKCIDAETGKFIWGYLPEGSGSLATRPIVTNGQLFVVTWGAGLWVFDAKTGKVIGADRSVRSISHDRNALYNGNFIYSSYESENNKRIITCIEPY